MNNQITYSIVEGNLLGHFAINPKNGQMHIAGHLDREEVSDRKCRGMSGSCLQLDIENEIIEPHLHKSKEELLEHDKRSLLYPSASYMNND